MNNKIDAKFLEIMKFKLDYLLRLLDRKPVSLSFSSNGKGSIERIYVINLDRKPERWRQVRLELMRIYYANDLTLDKLTRRFSAIDARYFDNNIDENVLLPYYTLSDQLKVEPNEKIPLDSDFLTHRIDMTKQEISIALSHIEIWKLVAQDDISHCLILEDDIFFKRGFTCDLDLAWNDLTNFEKNKGKFDILFLSYEEVGDPNKNKKKINTGPVKKPDLGIWQASGYVLSQSGAHKLLDMLPVYGPIDLWLNLKFDDLNVFFTSQPIIEQRFDVPSTNSYSIMPILSQIGVYTHESPLLIAKKRLNGPVFVFGEQNSGLTSLAIALSVLGYTCCSDLVDLPNVELVNFSDKKNSFDAYVNIGTFEKWSREQLLNIYPNARFIYTCHRHMEVRSEDIDDILFISVNHKDKWQLLCTYLDCEYPSNPYPVCDDIGKRNINYGTCMKQKQSNQRRLKFDKSPWIIESPNWPGISINEHNDSIQTELRKEISWSFELNFDLKHWTLRNDTFPSNLSLFSPSNVSIDSLGYIHLLFNDKASTVRSFTSAAIATKKKYLYGKFKVEIKPANVSGLITGVFLHRNSPHQEIDIEFLGKDKTKMLVNVFYNPGTEGSKLEYGYRGTPVIIDLGFDASKDFHIYEIEWAANSIKWSVDHKVIYERVVWNPTPIPDQPMEFNVNLWHTNSVELAGKLNRFMLPAESTIRSVQIFSIEQERYLSINQETS